MVGGGNQLEGRRSILLIQFAADALASGTKLAGAPSIASWTRKKPAASEPESEKLGGKDN